jgi:hypothetical protein
MRFRNGFLQRSTEAEPLLRRSAATHLERIVPKEGADLGVVPNHHADTTLAHLGMTA